MDIVHFHYRGSLADFFQNASAFAYGEPSNTLMYDSDYLWWCAFEKIYTA